MKPLKDKLKDNLKDKLKDNLKDKLKDNLKEKLKDNLKDNLMDNLKDNLRLIGSFYLVGYAIGSIYGIANRKKSNYGEYLGSRAVVGGLLLGILKMLKK